MHPHPMRGPRAQLTRSRPPGGSEVAIWPTWSRPSGKPSPAGSSRRARDEAQPVPASKGRKRCGSGTIGAAGVTAGPLGLGGSHRAVGPRRRRLRRFAPITARSASTVCPSSIRIILPVSHSTTVTDPPGDRKANSGWPPWAPAAWRVRVGPKDTSRPPGTTPCRPHARDAHRTSRTSTGTYPSPTAETST